MKYLLLILFFAACRDADHESVYLHNPHKVRYENMDSVAARGFYIHSKDGKNLIDLTIFAEHSVYIDGDLLDSVSNYNTVVINGYEYERKPPVYEAVGGRLRTGKVEPLKAVVTDNDSVLRYGEMYVDSAWVSVKIGGISHKIEQDNVHPAIPHTHSNVNNPNGEFYICKKH